MTMYCAILDGIKELEKNIGEEMKAFGVKHSLVHSTLRASVQQWLQMIPSIEIQGLGCIEILLFLQIFFKFKNSLQVNILLKKK